MKMHVVVDRLGNVVATMPAGGHVSGDIMFGGGSPSKLYGPLGRADVHLNTTGRPVSNDRRTGMMALRAIDLPAERGSTRVIDQRLLEIDPDTDLTRLLLAGDFDAAHQSIARMVAAGQARPTRFRIG